MNGEINNQMFTINKISCAIKSFDASQNWGPIFGLDDLAIGLGRPDTKSNFCTAYNCPPGLTLSHKPNNYIVNSNQNLIKEFSFDEIEVLQLV